MPRNRNLVPLHCSRHWLSLEYSAELGSSSSLVPRQYPSYKSNSSKIIPQMVQLRSGRMGSIPRSRNWMLGGASWYWCVWGLSAPSTVCLCCVAGAKNDTLEKVNFWGPNLCFFADIFFKKMILWESFSSSQFHYLILMFCPNSHEMPMQAVNLVTQFARKLGWARPENWR